MAEMTMLERVAQAWQSEHDTFFYHGDFSFCRVYKLPDLENDVFRGHPKSVRIWVSRQCALAVLHAMRNPPALIICAIEAMAEERYRAAPDMQRWYGDDVWNAGIDAALSEQP